MRKTGFVITSVVCLFATTTYMGAQARKAGLWDLTTIVTWQRSPVPGNPPPATPHTTQACFTQQQIDKYGAIFPQTPDCKVMNVVVKGQSTTADMVCSGKLSGKGTLKSSWTDDSHAVGSIHFVGSIQLGANNKAVEWTGQSSSVFKSTDCGSVQPSPAPPQ